MIYITFTGAVLYQLSYQASWELPAPNVAVSFSAVQIYDLSYIHLHNSSSTGILRTRNVTSLRSSLFCFLLAGESESQGEVARTHGARAKRGTNSFVTSVPEPSRDSRLPERKRKRLLRRLQCNQLPDEEPCRAYTSQNVKLLEGVKSDEAKTTEGLIIFNLENDDVT